MKKRLWYLSAVLASYCFVTFIVLAVSYGITVVVPPEGMVGELLNLMFVGPLVMVSVGFYFIVVLFRMIRFYSTIPSWSTMFWGAARTYLVVLGLCFVYFAIVIR